MNIYLIVCVAVMAVFTYLPRMLPLTFFRKEIHSPLVRSVLYYVPYAVLASLTFPAILETGGSQVSAAAGMITAIYFSYKEKGLVFVAAAAMAVYYLVSLCF